MRSPEYERYIRSEAWKQKAAERMSIDDYKCVMCGRPAACCRRSLQVHHISYKNLGHENALTDLVTLCGACHRKIHNYLNRRQ